jgi:pimeloyl-ACP methyl ester carboxylesterase
MKRRVVEQGSLGDGLAYIRVGTGSPLVYLPGLTTHHRLPQGMDRSFQVRQLRPLARHYDVWWVQRRQGMASGTTMADIASDYAAALHRRFRDPVDVVGSSTGGSAALQLAADHPEAVRRMVLLSSAARLSPAGRDAQRRFAGLLRRGHTRQASALMMSMLATGSRGKWLAARLGWLLGPTLKDEGVSDMLITIDAEDAFDLTGRLEAIRAPTLVVGGARDQYYGPAVFRETAFGLPNGRLILNPDKGHAGAQISRVTLGEVLRFLNQP